MNTLPDAVRLADWVDSYRTRKATVLEDVAAELRRLHEVNQMLVEALKEMRKKYGEYACEVCDKADDALAKAKEQA